jgi:hypothetical protein
VIYTTSTNVVIEEILQMNIRQIEIIFGDVNETDEKPHTATFVQMDIHGKELTMNMTLRIK